MVDNWDNSLCALTETASEETFKISSTVVVVTFVQQIVGRIAFVFMPVYSYTIIK